MFQNNYKARLAKMFVVNTSLLLKMIYGIVERFFDDNTRSKITLTTDSTTPELQELVCKSQLPKEYGGKCDIPKKGWPPYNPFTISIFCHSSTPCIPKGPISDKPLMKEEELKDFFAKQCNRFF